jgi:hypothetical protein
MDLLLKRQAERTSAWNIGARGERAAVKEPLHSTANLEVIKIMPVILYCRLVSKLSTCGDQKIFWRQSPEACLPGTSEQSKINCRKDPRDESMGQRGKDERHMGLQHIKTNKMMVSEIQGENRCCKFCKRATEERSLYRIQGIMTAGDNA